MIVLKAGEFFGRILRSLNDDNITLSLTDYDISDQLASEKHYHFHPNIFFILQGGVVEKCHRNTSENLTGSISFYHAGVPHQNIRKLFPSRSLNIEIENSFLAKYDIPENQVEVTISKNPLAKFLMLQVYRELVENDSLTATSIKMELLNLITNSEKLTSLHVWPLWIKRVYELLHERWNQTISLEELSNESGVHPITISRYFSRYLGCTLGQYVRSLKIERSLSLIKKNTSLTAIAFECGFADQSHFIRNFKQYTGYLPLEYKKMTGN